MREYKTSARMRERAKEYRKTKDGWVSAVFAAMKSNAKSRSIGLPDFSRGQLICFINSQQEKFDSLFAEWTNSGHDKWKKPSLDRVDNGLGYSLNNLRLVTWHENWIARIPTMSSVGRWKKSKLTKEMILKIRSLAAAGISTLEISKITDVHKSIVYNVKNRRTWKDVE